MRWGSGPDTWVPLTNTSPDVGLKKPATMFNKVDLPQPEGPTMQTNSPRKTSRSIFSRTAMGAVLPVKSMRKLRTWMIGPFLSKVSIPLRITPLHFIESFQLPYQKIQKQTHKSTHKHPAHHEAFSSPAVSTFHHKH